jgi:hypothetical protein
MSHRGTSCPGGPRNLVGSIFLATQQTGRESIKTEKRHGKRFDTSQAQKATSVNTINRWIKTQFCENLGSSLSIHMIHSLVWAESWERLALQHIPISRLFI